MRSPSPGGRALFGRVRKCGGRTDDSRVSGHYGILQPTVTFLSPQVPSLVQSKFELETLCQN